MKRLFLIRLQGLLIILALLWVTLGAPILPAEWQDIPHRVTIMLRQLPMRMGAVLLSWH